VLGRTVLAVLARSGAVERRSSRRMKLVTSKTREGHPVRFLFLWKAAAATAQFNA